MGNLFANLGRKGQLNYPVGIAINAQGEVIISECNNNRLQVFDYNTGQHLRFLVNNRELKSPWHLFLDAADNLYVGSFTNPSY